MQAKTANSRKGPALLARAGVSLAEAKWFYRHQRSGAAASDLVRLEAIRRKVSSFLAQ
jgi:hypothetical protein